MGWLRLVWRLAQVGAVTALAAAALYAGFAFHARAPRRRHAWRRRVFRAWARALCRALAVRQEVVGEPPREPCLLVSNHLSYLDIPVLACHVPAVFLSKSEVADWPVIGLLARSAGTLFIDRRRKRELPEVNRRIAGALANGDGVVAFPEGTSTRGDGVAPFRASILEPASRLNLPVRYATLSYATAPGDPPASEAVCWWGDMAFGPHILRMLRLRHVQARLVFGADAVQETDRKLLAERLQAAVLRSFVPSSQSS